MGAGDRPQTPNAGLRTYTINEVASLLKVSPKTVRRLIESGKLGAVRVGRVYRVPHKALEEFLAQSATKRREDEKPKGPEGNN